MISYIKLIVLKSYFFLDNLESNVRKMTSRSAGKPSPEEAEKANISSIDQYVELLYEELHDRIKGSSMILQLARNPDNLEALEQNGIYKTMTLLLLNI